MREAGTEAGGQRPVFTLDIVNDRRAGPAEQCRNDEADTLARTGRREGHDVLRAVMAQIVVSEPAEKDTGITMKAGALDLAGRWPTRGNISGEVACLPPPPPRTEIGRANV